MHKNLARKRTLAVTAALLTLGATVVPDQAAAEPIDAICFVAGATVGIWPIGTLIAGPTAVGCLIHYWNS